MAFSRCLYQKGLLEKQVTPCFSRDLSFYASLRDEIRPSFSQFHHLLDDIIQDSDPSACRSHNPAAQPFLTGENIF